MLGGEADRAVVEVLACGAAVSAEDVLSESLPQLAASRARGISRQRAREVRLGGGQSFNDFHIFHSISLSQNFCGR